MLPAFSVGIPVLGAIGSVVLLRRHGIKGLAIMGVPAIALALLAKDVARACW